MWTQGKGTKASSTGTIYGIYDLSGGSWEGTATIVNNENKYLYKYGGSLVASLNNGKSSKYVTIYPNDSSKDNTSISDTEANLNVASKANYAKNTKIYGDAIRETSTEGIGQTSWYSDYSCFTGLYNPFIGRGGPYWDVKIAGLFYFRRCSGGYSIDYGFRSVLVSQ